MFHSAKGEQDQMLGNGIYTFDSFRVKIRYWKRNLSILFCFQLDAELNTSATVFSLTNARSGPQSPESNKLCPLNWHWATMPPPASLQRRLIVLAVPSSASRYPVFQMSVFHSLTFIPFCSLSSLCNKHPVYKHCASCYGGFADAAILACCTELFEFDIRY
jgi:hypothetical protein